ncbi:aminotransferase family protein [Natronobacterium texcoconense]|uniref:Taurine---2-oxoglutarate transaminase n=1 Tax=Natronobacterium texcoconense TaxID=1095778 RepID=A0A1H1FQY3_NATTX|nr:aminotransferase class III-fold pyridoxal phosphate-dependent enzyme [Natronobacterium texcoconense]SDR03129.1 taurine---2-oxoglutarate transaminase [Natronobacterium texcoconense]
MQASDDATIPHWYDPDRPPVSITDGDGVHVTDDEGTQYLDFLSQLYCVNAGHGNQRIVDAMTEQLERVQYVSPSKRTPARAELAEELRSIAPGSLSDVVFSVSGSEANELAMQFAREYTGASKILTRWQSYHGSTYAAGALTGDPETRNAVESHAATTGVTKFLPPLSYRSPFDADSPEELAEKAANHLEYVIRNEGPDSIAAIVMEPIAGTSGAYTVPPGYFQRVRELCDEYDILLVADEVIAGFGRCGDWFGIDTEGVEPDMITFAKAVTSGYAPLAGVIAKPEITTDLREDGFPLGQTFGGHPVACAAATAAIEEYRDGLIENVREHEATFEAALATLEEEHDVVGTVRGRGFHWGVEFADPETDEPFLDPWTEDGHNPVNDVIAGAADRGVLVGSGRPTTQIVLSPPLLAGEDEIVTAVDAVSEAIDDAFE